MASTVELLTAARQAFYDNKPEARLTATAGVSIPNNSLGTVGLNSSTIDNWSGHSNSVNNSRYTVPVAGAYYVGAHVSFTANATGYRLLAIYQNGTEIANSRTYVTNVSGSVIATVVVPPNLIRANVGDYFELAAYQNSGGALTTGDGNGNSGIQFDIVFQNF